MTSPTTHKGNIGQTAVTLDALHRGYHVSIPLEGAAYDLIIDKNGKLFRVQVKYSTPSDKILTVRCNDYTNSDIDAIIVFDSTTKLTYWIPMDLVAESYGISLRLQPTKNGQTKGITFAETFKDW